TTSRLGPEPAMKRTSPPWLRISPRSTPFWAPSGSSSSAARRPFTTCGGSTRASRSPSRCAFASMSTESGAFTLSDASTLLAAQSSRSPPDENRRSPGTVGGTGGRRGRPLAGAAHRRRAQTAGARGGRGGGLVEGNGQHGRMEPDVPRLDRGRDRRRWPIPDTGTRLPDCRPDHAVLRARVLVLQGWLWSAGVARILGSVASGPEAAGYVRRAPSGAGHRPRDAPAGHSRATAWVGI